MKCVAARILGACSLLLFYPAIANSLGPTESPYLGIAGSYLFTDEDGRPTPVDDGGGVQLLFGWPSTGRWAFELHLAHHELDAELRGVDAKRTALGLDGVFFFNPRGPTAYLLAGIGVVRNDLDPVDEATDAFANAGIGVMSGPLTAGGLRLRADVRYVADNYHDKPDDVQANLGLTWPLRRAEPRRVAVERTEVEAPEPPPPPPPRDSDGDGVIDAIDRCPNTLAGAEVDRFGCAKEKAVVVLRDVHFEFDSAELTPDSRAILQRAVQAMRGQPSMQVEIAGHTDHIGSDAYNQRLSERRAHAVMSFLVRSGIPDQRLRAVGYGETQPIAPNTHRDGSDNPEGRAQNRRVEFKVLYR